MTDKHWYIFTIEYELQCGQISHNNIFKIYAKKIGRNC